MRRTVALAWILPLLFALPAGAVPGGKGKGLKGKAAKPAEAPKVEAKPPAPVGKPADPNAKPADPNAKPAEVAKTPAPAAKPASWEEMVTGATLPQDLGVLLEPLFAQCATGSDLAFRQCETIKNWHLSRIHTTRYFASADQAALQSQPYDPAEKTVTLTITGCLSCLKPPELGGAPRLVATKPPKGFAEGAPIGIDLGFHEVPLPDAKKAEKFVSKVLPRLRVEYVFTVGDPFEGGKGMKGVTIVPLAHRVYNQCTGEVLQSDPASKGPKTIAKRDPTCPASDAPTEEEVAEAAEQAVLPDTLNREDIERAMAPVQATVMECAAEFELKGVAKVRLDLSGDGTMQMKVLPPFDKGEANMCIRQAMKQAKFPKFKKGKIIPVEYPFVLRK